MSEAQAKALASIYGDGAEEDEVVDTPVAEAAPSSVEPPQASEVAPETVAPVETPAAEPELRSALPDEPDPMDYAASVIRHGDTRFPHSLWGKPVSALADSYNHASKKIQEQGEKANQSAREAAILRSALDMIQQQQAAAQPKPDAFEAAGFNPDEEFYQSPKEAFRKAIEIAREEARAELAPQIQNIRQYLENNEHQKRQSESIAAIERAGEAARQHLGVDPETWNVQATALASFVDKGELNPYDANSFVALYPRVFGAPKASAGTIPQEGTLRGAVPGAMKPTAVAQQTRTVPPKITAETQNILGAHPLFKTMGPEFAEKVAAAAAEKMEKR